MLKTAIIAVAKMEDLYIRDWVEYHKNIGISHIFIADNNPKDYSPALSSMLNEYKDFVTIFDYSDYIPHENGQAEIYTSMMETIIADQSYDWYACIDIDEYISIPKFANISEYLMQMPDYADYIALIWKYFTDNNVLYYENKPIYERFTHEKRLYSKENGYITKSIYRHSAYMKVRHIDRMHSVFQNHGDDVMRVDALGNPLFSHKTNIHLDNEQLDIIYDYACINHYQYKTAQEYAWKIKRGDVLGYEMKISAFFIINEYSEEKEAIIKNILNHK